MKRPERTIAALTLICLLTPGFGRLGHAQGIKEEQKTYTISGAVGVPSVTLPGLPGNVVSDQNGQYSAEVPYGWCGLVRPSKAGFQFDPPTREYSRVVADCPSQDYQAKVMTYTISGHVGLAGVTMQGLPGSPVSDNGGVYNARVQYGWSGTVTPTKAGFVFQPPSRTYVKVEADSRSEDYAPREITVTISGTVGVAGVTLTGLPGSIASRQDGTYSAQVPYDWCGKVTPIKAGFVFEPPTREYVKVEADQSSADYTAHVLTFTISGSVGMPDVALQGLPGETVSDAGGYYAARVEYGWTGVVAPDKEGYDFEPASRAYSAIIQNSSKQDYKATVRMVTITDTLRFGDGRPIPDVRVTAEPGEYSAWTDKAGRYTLQVPHGWSGTVSFSKEGYEFNPPAYSYQDLTSDKVADIQTRRWHDEVAGGRPPGIPTYPRRVTASPTDDVLIIPTREVVAAKFTETREDMQVMLNILREKLSEPRMILGTLYDYGDFFGSGRGMEAVYLQGYGAVFVMRVDFPLLPATEAQGQDEQTPAQPVDPVWQRARQKLYQPPYRRRDARVRPGGPGEMDFNQFRDDLLQTLRHAANIRNIEPNEWVILTVVGQSGEGFRGGFYGGGMMGGMGYGGSFSGGGGMMGGYGGGTYSSGGFYSSSSSYSSSSATTGRGTGRRMPAPAAGATVLTLQAKKADIDAFAKGGLDLEQFRQKVKTFTY